MIGFYGKQILKMIAQHILFPVCYAWHRRKKVIPHSVVFADAHKEQCPEQMQRLMDALMTRGYRVTTCFFNLETLGTAGGMKKMLAFMKVYAQARFVILQDNFLPVASCRKRKDTTVIQLWHGCGAFKKFGYDAEDDIPLYYKGNVYKNYDLVTVSSPYCRSYFMSAMRIENKEIVQALGNSYTDCYFDEAYQKDIRQSFEAYYGPVKHRRVIVWAPTFRGNAGQQGDADKTELPGEAYIDALSENPDYLVIKSLHPHMLHGKKLPFRTGELLLVADMLITDYSSVFFEYLLVDKPIVFFAPDYESYYEKRGFYLNYRELPGQVVTDATVLSQAVKNALREPETGSFDIQKRKQFREQYMGSCDGNATKRIVKYMTTKEKRQRC